MAFSEFEIRRIKKIVDNYINQRRPPPHIRSELDISFRLSGQSVEIFEIRPDWKEPEVIREHPVAKTTYVKRSNSWKVYWMRADLQWHRYDPALTVDRIETFLDLLEADEYACFWG